MKSLLRLITFCARSRPISPTTITTIATIVTIIDSTTTIATLLIGLLRYDNSTAAIATTSSMG